MRHSLLWVSLAFLLCWTLVSCQEEGSGDGTDAEGSGKLMLYFR